MSNRKVKLINQLALHLLMNKLQISRKVTSQFWPLLSNNICQMQARKTTGTNCTSRSPTKRTWLKRTSSGWSGVSGAELGENKNWERKESTLSCTRSKSVKLTDNETISKWGRHLWTGTMTTRTGSMNSDLLTSRFNWDSRSWRNTKTIKTFRMCWWDWQL